MSAEALGWALAQRTQNCARKALLVALANVADDEGFVRRVRIDYLERATDLARASLYARLRELESGGALARERGAAASRDQRVVSCWLDLAATFVLPDKVLPEKPKDAASASPPPNADCDVRSPADNPVDNAGQGPPETNLQTEYESSRLDRDESSRLDSHLIERKREIKDLEPAARARALPDASPVPSGGADAGLGEEARGPRFADFLSAFPFDAESMLVSEARLEFLGLEPHDQHLAVDRAKLYRDALRRSGAAPRDAAVWLAARAFEGPASAPAVPAAAVFVARGTRAWAAWEAAWGQKKIPVTGRDGQTGWWFKSLFPPGARPP